VKTSRIAAATAGTLVGFGALVGYSALHSAAADPSAPLPPNTDLTVPQDVTASANTWAYARSPQLSLTTSVAPQTVTPGSRITYTYLVQNLTTDTAFNQIVVTDDKCEPVTFIASSDPNANKQLDPSETWKYTCSTTILKDQQNAARVTAKTVVGPAASPSPSPSVSPTITPSASPSPSPSPTQKLVVDGTYTGSAQSVYIPDANETYTIQTQVTIVGGKITAITIPQFTATDATSKSIGKFDVSTTPSLNGAGNDTLIDRAIVANSASIAAVAGATYTSTGFKNSLQTALTQAGY
jgi:uncharacterized repeat protein (TIGR01451 family)